MTIHFPSDLIPVLSEESTLVFYAVKEDGKTISCQISFEALEERFGTKATTIQDLYRAFRNNRTAIHEKASEALALNGGNPVLLMREHF